MRIFLKVLGKRAGAFTVGLDIWHLDIEAFLKMQNEEGDIRKKVYDVFPQVIIPDYFMECKKENKDWLLVDPYEVKQKFGVDLTESWGNTFLTDYLNVCENSDLLENCKWVKANDLWRLILRTQTETGLPYIFYKDTANKYNPNQDSGYIPQANLCVSPETLLLTKEGNLPIGTLEGKEVEVWNGGEWSKVIVKKTGENRKIIKVIVGNLLHDTWVDITELKVVEIECTPEHTFYLYDSDVSNGLKTQAQFLTKGDRLIDTEYPDGTIQKWQVVEVVDNQVLSPTFCVTEPLRHKAVFNNVLMGQCVESYSNVSPDQYTHCCNLVSINLANMVEEKDEEHIARLAVQILENAIELTEPPIPEAKAHNEYYRTIGVGFMGLADWLAYHKKNYYTGKDVAKSLFERYALYAIDESVEIARVKGSFGAYSRSEWSKGNLLGRDISWFLANTDNLFKWMSLSLKVQEYGIRHSQIFAIAPNTTTSLLQGCTASILPPYNLFFYDANGKGKYPIAPPYLEDCEWFYNENTNMDQKVLIDFISYAIVPFIDSGISMELNFNLNNPEITPKYISETLQLAWEKECKTIYYVRSVTPKDKEQCIMCSN